MHDSHDFFRPGIVAADAARMLSEASLYVGCYSGIQRAVFALKHIDKIHAFKIAHFDMPLARLAIEKQNTSYEVCCLLTDNERVICRMPP
jgi:hypothetical protein